MENRDAFDDGERSKKPQLLGGTLTLRPEHYRAVTSTSQKSKGRDATTSNDEESGYEYPAVPITYLGRKRLSDTLFLLSKDIPSFKDDVASLLHEARKQEEWDLAVAEILTQVVVGLHCTENDRTLDGLSQYLLRIGISS
jgi:hypothetical protein